jgi:hypothetical protein
MVSGVAGRRTAPHVTTHARKRWRERINALECDPAEAIVDAFRAAIGAADSDGPDVTLVLRHSTARPAVVTVWRNQGNGPEVQLC